MEQQEAVAFIQEHNDVLVQLWKEAEEKGLTDVAFVWMIEAEEGSDDGKLFARYMTRDEAYSVLSQDPATPEYTLKQFGSPAGPGRAWLLLMAPSGTASMRVTMTHTAPGGSA